MRERGRQTNQAHAKYVEAQQSLTQFQQDHPGWNDRVVNYRMNYLAEKISGPTETAAPVAASVATANTNPVAADASADTGNQAATPVTDTGTPAPAAVARPKIAGDAARTPAANRARFCVCIPPPVTSRP